MKLFDLSGKVAIVTGGNGGIGLAIGAALAEAGAQVLLVGRNASKGERAAKELGGKAAFIAADVARKADCVAMVAGAVARFGRVDILVNNAGTTVRKTPQDYSEAEWGQVIDVNLTGAFYCCQAAYPQMVRAGGGKIVNIASLIAIMGAAHNVPYAASKGGLAALTRALAVAWAGANIQVNAILPGWIETEMTASAKAHVPGLAEQVITRAPVGRWGQPRDLAGLAVFLSAPASDFVTGTAIPAFGGFSIKA